MENVLYKDGKIKQKQKQKQNKNRKKDLSNPWPNAMCGWKIASVFIYFFIH